VIVLGLGVVSVAGFFALLVLRRHRGLAREFVQAEELASRRERELQVEREVGRLKSNFVSMVSHEFRTPLGVITASAGNLQRYFSRLPEEQRTQLLGDIMNSSSRMRDLIEEVLLLGKVESGNMKCQPALVDLPALCRGIIEEVSAAGQNRCPIEFAADGPPAEVRVDNGLARIIVTNLLNNATKYSPANNPVHLALRIEGREAVFEIRDEGIGIPTADQAGLFQSFHRGHNVGNVPGTGLGLTIVKRCVDLHSGNISFVSKEGEGTIFNVRLPLDLPP
jgi:signal transduction histidine kinase